MGRLHVPLAAARLQSQGRGGDSWTRCWGLFVPSLGPGCDDPRNDAKVVFNVLFVLKNAMGLCKHVAGGKPTSAAVPGNGQQELCRLANAAMLPAALPGGQNCWLQVCLLELQPGNAPWYSPRLGRRSFLPPNRRMTQMQPHHNIRCQPGALFSPFNDSCKRFMYFQAGGNIHRTFVLNVSQL